MKVVELKKKMVDKGRDDFVNFLSEILGVGKPTASKKLNEEVAFTLDDVSKCKKTFDLTPDEVVNIFLT